MNREGERYFVGGDSYHGNAGLQDGIYIATVGITTNVVQTYCKNSKRYWRKRARYTLNGTKRNRERMGVTTR